MAICRLMLGRLLGEYRYRRVGLSETASWAVSWDLTNWFDTQMAWFA